MFLMKSLVTFPKYFALLKVISCLINLKPEWPTSANGPVDYGT
jgi:hypothetical protein